MNFLGEGLGLEGLGFGISLWKSKRLWADVVGFTTDLRSQALGTKCYIHKENGSAGAQVCG